MGDDKAEEAMVRRSLVEMEMEMEMVRFSVSSAFKADFVLVSLDAINYP
jgi:hypothetical protein